MILSSPTLNEFLFLAVNSTISFMSGDILLALSLVKAVFKNIELSTELLSESFSSKKLSLNLKTAPGIQLRTLQLCFMGLTKNFPQWRHGNLDLGSVVVAPRSA
jgi:hypothetical protein